MMSAGSDISVAVNSVSRTVRGAAWTDVNAEASVHRHVKVVGDGLRAGVRSHEGWPRQGEVSALGPGAN